MTEKGTVSFKIPNGNLGKALKTGGAVGLIIAMSYFFNAFVKPDIVRNTTKIENVTADFTDHVIKQAKFEAKVESLSEDVKEIKDDNKEIMKMQQKILSKLE